ncbi:MAG: peptidoglycan editing factor PgeF [Candidatus Omnitrophota bacterium]
MKTSLDCLLDRLKGGYQFSLFKDLGVLALFTDRHDNFSFRNNHAPSVLKARHDFLGQVGINFKDLICVKQVHSSRVSLVTEIERGKGSQDFDSALVFSDGIITDVKKLPIAIFIADCLAIYFFDPAHNSIGIIHAGWRGSAQKISLKVIELMNEHFSCRPQDLIVAFSPSIRSCCYAVGLDMRDYFVESLIEKEGKLFLDLALENKNQLLSAGVKEENIIDSRICTSCHNEEFFSYRKEGEKAGRMMAVISME